MTSRYGVETILEGEEETSEMDVFLKIDQQGEERLVEGGESEVREEMGMLKIDNDRELTLSPDPVPEAREVGVREPVVGELYVKGSGLGVTARQIQLLGERLDSYMQLQFDGLGVEKAQKQMAELRAHRPKP